MRNAWILALAVGATTGIMITCAWVAVRMVLGG